jgi:glycosyltransferase involved in cell wall biosynthesis
MEGGAERATFEFAKRWVKNQNAKVTWLSPCYDSNIKNETIEGIDFEYVGLPLSRNIFWLLVVFPLFYISVIYTYLTKYKGKVDVVIDQVHGIPYLTPLYVTEKIVVYIHEVAGEIWKIMYPFPVNYLGLIAEKLFFSIYRFLNIKFIANSMSTLNDLRTVLKIKKENISMIPYGVTAPIVNLKFMPKKEKNLTIVYLNRLVKMKGIERGIKVFQKVIQEYPEAKMWIIGKGEDKYVNHLKELVIDKKLESSVIFLGYIDGEEKFDYLAKAHVLINPSYLEGWGLVNIEANRMGTPVVAFDVKGCRDSIVNGINGYLSPDGNIESMTEKIFKIYEEDNLQESSWKYSNEFDWDSLEKEFLRQLEK